jgi:hypothetical protein
MVARAELNPCPVRDDPATLETLRLARLLPTATAEIPLANRDWYCAASESAVTDLTVTAVIRLLFTVTVTAISSCPPGEE